MHHKRISRKTLPAIKSTAFIAILLFGSTIFFTSCSDFSSRQYYYIQTTMHQNMDSIVPVEESAVYIKAKTDSAAYTSAWLYFCLAERDYRERYQKKGLAEKPISFRLLTEDSVDIAKTITFANKKMIEKILQQKVDNDKLPSP